MINISVCKRFLSVFRGKLFFLDDLECNLHLPTGFQSIPEHDFSQESADGSIIADCHLHRDENNNFIGIKYSLSDSRISETSFDGVMTQEAILMSKIIRCLPKFKGINDEFIQLNQQLDDWLHQLPSMFKETQANLERCKYDHSDFTTNYVLVHAFYRCLIVLLNRPLLDMLQDEISETAALDFYTLLDKCISTVNDVAMLLTQHNGAIENLPPLASYLTYFVGTVTINNGFSPNKHENQKADMARKRVYWDTVDKLYCMMVELYNVNKKILEISLLTPFIDDNNLIIHGINDAPSTLPFTTYTTEEDIVNSNTIDQVSFNSTLSLFYINDWLID